MHGVIMIIIIIIILCFVQPISLLSPRKLGVVLCILSTELCERLAYYGVVANLVLFCTSNLDFSSNDAATISLVFSGVCQWNGSGLHTAYCYWI